MPTPVATPIADALLELLAGLTTPPLKTYRWAPSRLGTIPAAVIDLPRIERTALDTGERELGSDDWRLTFPLNLYVDLRAADDQQDALDLLEAFIHAVDANPSLGDPTIDDTKAVAGTPSFDLTDQARPLLVYECEVQVWKRVIEAP